MLTEIQQFTTDVITAAGLLYHGKKDKALASRIDTGAVDLRMWIQQYAAAAAAQARMKAIEQCLIKVTGLSVDVERCKQLQLTTQAWEEALDDAAAAIQKLKVKP